MLAVVDYGMGNLHSVSQAIRRFGVRVVCTDDVQHILGAQAIVLPGVGAFGEAMRCLREKQLDAALVEAVGRGIPLLGICLGMQLLCASSTEHGTHEGLGLLSGTVTRIDRPLNVPHMGWNALRVHAQNPLCSGVDGGMVYFVHSYHVTQCTHVWATVDYGGPIAAIIGRDRVVGMQFHPEKSGRIGWRLLANFLQDARVVSLQQDEDVKGRS
jgi:glutamine amidotransferase